MVKEYLPRHWPISLSASTAWIKAEVEKRLAGNAPKGNGGAPAEITKESAKKMSMAELQNLFTTNRELYNKLFG